MIKKEEARKEDTCMWDVGDRRGGRGTGMEEEEGVEMEGGRGKSMKEEEERNEGGKKN